MRDQAFPFIFTGAFLVIMLLAHLVTRFFGVDVLLGFLIVIIALVGAALFTLCVLLIRERINRQAKASGKEANVPTKTFSTASAPATSNPIKPALAAESTKAETNAREGSIGPLWWRREGDLLRIGGEGEMPDSPSWGDGSWEITAVVIEEGVLSVGKCAFENKRNLTRIALPKGLKTIGDSAFASSGLEEVMLPEGMIWIGSEAFNNCRKLHEVTMPDSVAEIRSSAFYGCDSLSHITLPRGLKTIGGSAFAQTGLEEIALPTGVTRIESNSFAGCHKLKEVTMPDSVTEIGWSAFYGCDSLSHVTLPKGLKRIEGQAFSHAGIRELKFPEGLASIGQYAFEGMPLAELTIPDSVTHIESPLFLKMPTFPVHLPKGREGIVVYHPLPITWEQESLRRLGDAFFGNRCDVLQEPTGDPAGDRYTAMLRLLAFVKEYLGQRPRLSYESSAQAGKLHFCCEITVSSIDNCYDGGCGPSWDMEEYGVTIAIFKKEEVRQVTAGLQLIQEKPFPIWWKGREGLLEQPFGLSDCFEVKGDYPIHLPATANGQDLIRNLL